MSGTLVIGIGNSFRGDDGAGPSVARELERLALPNLTVRVCGGESLALMELWDGSERVILVDAMEAGQKPGTVFRFDAWDKNLPLVQPSGSTHAFGVVEAIELARRLDRLPPEVVVFGIQGTTYEAGHPMSEGVRQGVSEVVGWISRDFGGSRPFRADIARRLAEDEFATERVPRDAPSD